MVSLWAVATLALSGCECSVGKCATLKVRKLPYMCVRDEKSDVVVVGTILQHGLWEAHIVHHMIRALRRHPDAIMLDIGSHLGQYGIVAASMGRRVIAVDANPDNVRHLQASVNVNNFKHGFHIYNVGVDRHDGGYVRVDGPKDNTGGWGTLPCENENDPGCVPTFTVDHLVKRSGVDLNRRFVMKMDIEGHEPGAMAGARKVLKFTDVIFMEWSKQDGYVDMFNQLRSQGFTAPCNHADECPWDVVWTRT